jgi:hypothetical protein
MYLVACGVSGFGDLIWETERGRPFGMSTERLRLSRLDSRLDDDECLSRLEWCLDERLSLSDDEECFDELLFDEDLCDEECLDDLSLGTSRMFSTRPVVGSVVDDWEGSWET